MVEWALGRPFWVGFHILACSLCLFSYSHAIEPRPLEVVNSFSPLVLELSDSTLIAEVWNAINEESELPEGEFQVLLPQEKTIQSEVQESENQAIVLLNGSEVGRLGLQDWERISSETKTSKRKGWHSSELGADRQEVPLIWNALEFNPQALLAGMQWPAGIAIGMNTNLTSLVGVNPQVQRNLDFSWSQKLWTHLLLGLDLHRSQYGGGLTYVALKAKSKAAKAIVKPSSTRPASSTSPSTHHIDYWGEQYWWWSITAGFPGIKYTLALANQPLPKYFWLDPNASKAVKTFKSGPIVRQWADSSFEKAENFSHTIDMRLGYLRYGFHFDTDAYRVPIHSFYLDDLPALFGTWGTGLILASDIVCTRMWMDIHSPGLILPLPDAHPTTFKFTFLRLDLAYRTVRNFSLGISVRIHLDNAFLNLPGV